MLIFLVGYMASGKSKYGQGLASKLGYRFADTDKLIETNTGRKIAELFEINGELTFREMEQEVLHSFNESDNAVVATGGGLPCFFENMKWMKKHGLTIYLKVPVGMLVQRLSESHGERPLVKNLSPEELKTKVISQLKDREPVYMQSDLIVDAAGIKENKLYELCTAAMKKIS